MRTTSSSGSWMVELAVGSFSFVFPPLGSSSMGIISLKKVGSLDFVLVLVLLWNAVCEPDNLTESHEKVTLDEFCPENILFYFCFVQISHPGPAARYPLWTLAAHLVKVRLNQKRYPACIFTLLANPGRDFSSPAPVFHSKFYLP